MPDVLDNRLGGLSAPRKSVVRLTDRPDMTLDVHRGRKTTLQQLQNLTYNFTNLKGARHTVYSVYAMLHQYFNDIKIEIRNVISDFRTQIIIYRSLIPCCKCIAHRGRKKITWIVNSNLVLLSLLLIK